MRSFVAVKAKSKWASGASPEGMVEKKGLASRSNKKKNKKEVEIHGYMTRNCIHTVRQLDLGHRCMLNYMEI